MADFSSILAGRAASAELVRYPPEGAGAVGRTVFSILRERKRLTDRLSTSEIDDILSGTGSIDIASKFNTARNSLSASAIPTTGYYMAGQFVHNTAFVETGSPAYTVLGWLRLTTGNAHVFNTDWREMRCLTGN